MQERSIELPVNRYDWEHGQSAELLIDINEEIAGVRDGANRIGDGSLCLQHRSRSDPIPGQALRRCKQMMDTQLLVSERRAEVDQSSWSALAHEGLNA